MSDTPCGHPCKNGNSKLIQCLNEYTMSSPENRKIKNKSKSNDPATEKIETYG